MKTKLYTAFAKGCHLVKWLLVMVLTVNMNGSITIVSV